MSNFAGMPVQPGYYASIPPKIQAAFEYIRHCQNAQNPQPAFDGCKSQGAELSAKEETVRQNALDVLNRYFTGEDEFMNHLKPPDNPPEDDKPKERVTA